jgi:phosphoglycolate phosphatase-like HAD superfamily hydrolase
MKHLIFDFDGVLGDTLEVRDKAVMEIDGLTQEQTTQKFKEFFNRPQFNRDGKYIGKKVSKKTTQAQTAQFDPTWLTRYSQAVLKHGFNLFDGFIHEIEEIKDAQLAIISTGSREYILPKMENTNLNFSHILDFNDHPSKQVKLEQICADWKIDLKTPFYFTDTQVDVRELEKIMNPKKIIGCAWGYHGFDLLREVLPEKQILRKFSDIHKISFP